MRIHKMWTGTANGVIRTRHQNGANALKSIGLLLTTVDPGIFNREAQQFRTIVNPPAPFAIHLFNVVSFLQNNMTQFRTALKNLDDKQLMPALYRDVRAYRQATLCSLCSWNNSPFFDTEGRVLTYRSNSCLRRIERHIDTLSMKYNQLFRFYLLVDEFSILVTGRRLLPARATRKYLRYANLVGRCSLNSRDMSVCGDICRELNINRYTDMWDGEPEFIDDANTKVLRFFEQLKNQTPQTRPAMFVFRARQWMGQNLNFFRQSTSVLSGAIPTIVEETTPLIGSFDVRMRTGGAKGYIEAKHPSNSVQLDLLDDALNSTSLYKIIETPVDMSTFLVVYDNIRGIDMIRDAKDINFDLTVDELLGLLHSGKSDAKTINEIIDQSVVLALQELDIKDISSFAVDAKMFFKKFPKAPVKKNETNTDSSWGSRSLAGVEVTSFAGFVLFVINLV